MQGGGGDSGFRKTSELGAEDRQWISDFLSDKPWFNFYYQSSLDSLSTGLDNRSYLIGRKTSGLIMAIHFDEVSAFTTVGGVCLDDVVEMTEWPGRAELHVTGTQLETVRGLCKDRIRRTDTIRYYSLDLAGREERPSRAREVGSRDRAEVVSLFRDFYPETVISDWMLDQPMAGLWIDGKLVATLGMLAISERLKGCHVGNLLVHGDYRGRGLAVEVAEKQFTILRGRGIETAMLGVFGSNAAACRTYEKIGFLPVESRPLVYLNAKS